MSSNGFPAMALALFLAGGSSADDAGTETQEDPIVHAPGTEVGFHRKCADAERYRVQAYAVLESSDDRARALAHIHARRDPVRREEIFVGMNLVAMQLEAGPDWSDTPYSIRLNACSSARQIEGPDHTEYDANPEPGLGERRTFRTDAHGSMAWLDFVEPTEPEGRTDRSYNWSPPLETTAGELGIDESDRRVQLGLTLTHGATGAQIRLTGPALWVPDRIWYLTPPEPRRLGFFGMLNPFDEGSVWAALSNASRHGRCIDERRYAKLWFRKVSPASEESS